MKSNIDKATYFICDKYDEFENDCIEHAIAVKDVAIEFDQTNLIEIGCLLHDTIEDCVTDFTKIKLEFGIEVADIVYDVTDELGRNRKERHEKTYPKTAKNIDAVNVKLCDRISNLRRSINENNFAKMYLKEHDYFYDTLSDNGKNINNSNKKLWSEYLKLIFKLKENEIS